jgi:hypothetical protein
MLGLLAIWGMVDYASSRAQSPTNAPGKEGGAGPRGRTPGRGLGQYFYSRNRSTKTPQPKKETRVGRPELQRLQLLVFSGVCLYP